MPHGKEICRAPAMKLETMPVMLSGSGLGSGLPGQLFSIAASIGMTLLTLTAAVS